MPRRRCKIVVSDFHLGKGRHLRDGTQNILEDFVYDREFAEFLYYHCIGEFAGAEVELVLNGDILNLLQIDSYGVFTHLMTERLVTRALERIVAGHPEFFAALRAFANSPYHSVRYVVGNHDVGMLWAGPRRVFNEACGATVIFHDVAYVEDGVHIEHGQQYEWFAQVNMRRPFITRGLPEPVLNLPWGSLFVAVVMPRLKQERPHLDKVRPFQIFIIWTLIHDLLWGFKAARSILRFVIETFLFKGRYRVMQSIRATLGMLKEITFYPNYDKIAGRILKDQADVHTVIFGHTHILRYRQWREGKEYFNEGSWNEVTNLDLAEFGTRTRLTYAHIDYPQPASPDATSDPTTMHPKTRLREWKGAWRPEVEILA